MNKRNLCFVVAVLALTVNMTTYSQNSKIAIEKAQNAIEYKPLLNAEHFSILQIAERHFLNYNNDIPCAKYSKGLMIFYIFPAGQYQIRAQYQTPGRIRYDNFNVDALFEPDKHYYLTSERSIVRTTAVGPVEYIGTSGQRGQRVNHTYDVKGIVTEFEHSRIGKIQFKNQKAKDAIIERNVQTIEDVKINIARASEYFTWSQANPNTLEGTYKSKDGKTEITFKDNQFTFSISENKELNGIFLFNNETIILRADRRTIDGTDWISTEILVYKLDKEVLEITAKKGIITNKIKEKFYKNNY